MFDWVWCAISLMTMFSLWENLCTFFYVGVCCCVWFVDILDRFTKTWTDLPLTLGGTFPIIRYRYRWPRFKGHVITQSSNHSLVLQPGDEVLPVFTDTPELLHHAAFLQISQQHSLAHRLNITQVSETTILVFQQSVCKPELAMLCSFSPDWGLALPWQWV